MMMSPDVYTPNGYLPTSSNNQHLGNSYLPSVSYSLDHLDRLEYQVSLVFIVLISVVVYNVNSSSISCFRVQR